MRKADALMNILQKNSVDRTIIFCNKIETCRAIENVINRKRQEKFKVRAVDARGARILQAATKSRCPLTGEQKMGFRVLGLGFKQVNLQEAVPRLVERGGPVLLRLFSNSGTDTRGLGHMHIS